jgi:indole-3-glycerol phosphate synthase
MTRRIVEDVELEAEEEDPKPRKASKKGGKNMKKKVTKNAGRKAAKKEVRSRESKTGKYQSMKHLAEALFAKNKELTREQFIAEVKKEYPNSPALENEARMQEHYGHYRHFVVNRQEFTIVPRPAWAKGARAKIKKATKKAA